MTPTAIVLFLLPVFLCLFIYVTAFVFYLHQRHPGRIWRRLRNTNLAEYSDVLDAGRDIVATLWDVQGWLWFGYEVKGLENIPADGGALIVYYHGALPVDYYYFVAKVRSGYTCWASEFPTLDGEKLRSSLADGRGVSGHGPDRLASLKEWNRFKY